MPILTLVVYLAIIGLVVWLVVTYVPEPIKRVIVIVVVVLILIWVIQLLGFTGPTVPTIGKH